MADPVLRDVISKVRKDKDPEFTMVDLRGHDIGDKGMFALADALQHNKTVTVLYLWHANIGEEGAHVLLETLRQSDKQTVHWVSLHGNPHIRDETRQAINQHCMRNRSLHNHR